MSPVDKRVAILGPFTPQALAGHIPALAAGCPRGTGGPSLVNLVLARLRAGLPTDVITLDPELDADVRSWDGGLARLWVVRRRARHAVRDAFRVERRVLHRALAESGAGICHANWAYEYGLAAVTQRTTPVVVTLHDHAWRIFRRLGLPYSGLFAISLRVMRRARVLTAVAPHVAGFAERVCGGSVPVIPNVLPDGVETRRRLPEAGRVVSALAWVSLKNVRRALDAFRLLRAAVPGAVYRLMGPGLQAGGPAHQWALANGAASGVEFLGSLPLADALDEIASAQVVFHPSLEEAMPGPVAEAMALGVPVVAARQAAGCAWLVEEGASGTLCDGTAAEEMANALGSVLRAPAAAELLADKGRERIRALCRPDVVLKSYAGEYERAERLHRGVA